MIVKKFIKDMDVIDVITRLQHGEVLHSSTSVMQYLPHGVIVRHYTDDNTTVINSSISMSGEYWFEIEAEHAVELQVGKFYTNRDGEKLYCYNCKDDKFYFAKDNEGIVSVYRNGCYKLDGSEDSDDIIGEWSDE